jgi:rod shape-determining protein MreC
MAENGHLRRLMEAREHLPVRSMMSEILYDARDPSTRRVVLDRGSQNGVKLGLPVIDNAGVVGQVTRVFPFTAEVTLLTDKEQAIPVQVLRNGLRSVAYGRGQSGQLDLRFVAPNADIQVGDVLVTSGLDGMYPAGLAVAKVTQVESVAQGAFGRVVCQPLAGIDRHRQLLIVMSDQPAQPRPAAEAPKNNANNTPRRNLPKMAPIPLPPLPPQPLPPAVQPVQQPAAGTPGTPPGAAAPAANGAGAPAATSPAAAPAGAAQNRATTPARSTPPAAPNGAAARPPAAAPAGAGNAAGTPPANNAAARQPDARMPAARMPAAARTGEGA